MSDNKKYYYLKLKDNFFDSEEIIILQNMQDGYLYSDILFKMYLRSLKNEGLLMFNNFIPYDANILSQIVRHSVGVVEKAIKLFQQLSLIEVLDNGAIYMLNIQNYIGNSSTEADRQREYQNRIKTASIVPCKKSNKETNSIPTPERKIELNIDTELNKEKEKKTKKQKIDYEESFNIFYELYNYPFNKIQAQEEWKKIDIELHQDIYNHVREYRSRGQGVEFPFKPNNYLKRKRWTEGIEDFKSKATIKNEDSTIEDRLKEFIR